MVWAVLVEDFCWEVFSSKTILTFGFVLDWNCFFIISQALLLLMYIYLLWVEYNADYDTVQVCFNECRLIAPLGHLGVRRRLVQSFQSVKRM